MAVFDENCCFFWARGATCVAISAEQGVLFSRKEVFFGIVRFQSWVSHGSCTTSCAAGHLHIYIEILAVQDDAMSPLSVKWTTQKTWKPNMLWAISKLLLKFRAKIARVSILEQRTEGKFSGPQEADETFARIRTKPTRVNGRYRRHKKRAHTLVFLPFLTICSLWVWDFRHMVQNTTQNKSKLLTKFGTCFCFLRFGEYPIGKLTLCWVASTKDHNRAARLLRTNGGGIFLSASTGGYTEPSITLCKLTSNCVFVVLIWGISKIRWLGTVLMVLSTDGAALKGMLRVVP